jgi:hypothetical protein
MYLEELIDFVVIAKLRITLLEMLNTVGTCVPDFWGRYCSRIG